MTSFKSRDHHSGTLLELTREVDFAAFVFAQGRLDEEQFAWSE
jgi:hypothetical protein